MKRDHGIDYFYCDHCTVLFQFPPFDASQYQHFYENVQRSEATGYCSTDVPAKHLKKKQRDTEFKWLQLNVLGIQDLLCGKRVFEIGPAEGTLLASFRDKGFSTRGIEPLGLYARYARENHKLEVVEGYFNEECAKTERADLVILDNVLEHLIDPSGTLQNVRKILEPNGLLYIAVPSAETATLTNANISHITLWTRSSLALALANAGFQPISIINGRPATRPHEWVSLSRVCPHMDIRELALALYPPIAYEVIRHTWKEQLVRHQRAVERARRYGKLYPILARVYRAFRRAIGIVSG